MNKVANKYVRIVKLACDEFLALHLPNLLD